MKQFKKLLSEIEISLDKIIVVECLLEAVLLFIICVIILMLVSVNVLYSFIPTTAFFVIRLYLKLSVDKAYLIEQKWDLVNEKLRTAEDNLDLENEIVEQLQAEILTDIRDVKLSSFVNLLSVTWKVFAAVILSFLMLFLAVEHIAFIDIGDIIDNVSKYNIISGGGAGTGDVAAAGTAGSDDIFGAESIAQIGDEEISVEIANGGFEITGVRNEPPPKREFAESFPDELGLTECDSPPCVLESDIPVDQQELVKDYFVELSGG